MYVNLQSDEIIVFEFLFSCPFSLNVKWNGVSRVNLFSLSQIEPKIDLYIRRDLSFTGRQNADWCSYVANTTI